MDQKTDEINGDNGHVSPASRSHNGTPLHVAASQGDFELVKKLFHSTPELADATDSRRRLPLHLASAGGHTKIASHLLSNDRLDTCSARDVDGRNPLHLAAINGKVEVLKELVDKCPHAAEARTDRGETILHLCFKYNHKKALNSLIGNAKLQELVNAKDDDGNTLLHLAVADPKIAAINVEVVKGLLGCRKIDVSMINSDGETPLDIIFDSEANPKTTLTGWIWQRWDSLWRCCKLDAGATNSHGEAPLEKKVDLSKVSFKMMKRLKKDERSVTELQLMDALLEHGAKKAKELGRIEWLTKKRDALMVVASLIATMAFQAAVSPPGGVWQDNNDGHKAGETVMAYNYPDSFPYFLRLNTVGFVGSLSTILLLISELPFRKKTFMWVLVVIMWMTITAMAFTYSFAIVVVTPVKDRGPLATTIKIGVIVWVCVMVVLLVIHTVRLIRNVIKEQKVKRSISKTKKHWTKVRAADPKKVKAADLKEIATN